MRQVLRLPRQELDLYNGWLQGDVSWKQRPLMSDNVLKGWYLYWPDGCRASLRLQVEPDSGGVVFALSVETAEGKLLWSQKECDSIEGIYYDYGRDEKHEILIMDENDSEENWDGYEEGKQ